jgi:hypothetical protein
MKPVQPVGDPFTKVIPGQPIQFSAQAWNAMLAAAQEQAEQRYRGEHRSLANQGTLIAVQNQSGVPLQQYSILGLNGPLVIPCQATLDSAYDTGNGYPPTPESSLYAFMRQVTFAGVMPDIMKHRRRYCVTLDPAPIDGIVRAYITGICPALVDLKDQYDEYANIIDTTQAYSDFPTDHLESSRHGHARILWAEQDCGYAWGAGCTQGYTTGLQWCIVNLGVTGSSGAMGVANGDISARVDNTVGTGMVTLCRMRTGKGSDVPSGEIDVLTETVNVFNISAELTANGNGIDHDTFVSVEWDSEDVAWVAPLECTATGPYA